MALIEHVLSAVGLIPGVRVLEAEGILIPLVEGTWLAEGRH